MAILRERHAHVIQGKSSAWLQARPHRIELTRAGRSIAVIQAKPWSPREHRGAGYFEVFGVRPLRFNCGPPLRQQFYARWKRTLALYRAGGPPNTRAHRRAQRTAAP